MKFSFGDICIKEKQILTYMILNYMLFNSKIEEHEKQDCFELGVKLLTGQLIQPKYLKLQNKLFINGFILSMPEKKRPLEQERNTERPFQRRQFEQRNNDEKPIYRPFLGYPPFRPPPLLTKQCYVCKIKFTPCVFAKHISMCKSAK